MFTIEMPVKRPYNWKLLALIAVVLIPISFITLPYFLTTVGAELAPGEILGVADTDPMVEAKRTIRTGPIVLAVTFGGFGTWAALAPLSGAVIVPGVVQVDSYRKTVQHLEEYGGERTVGVGGVLEAG